MSGKLKACCNSKNLESLMSINKGIDKNSMNKIRIIYKRKSKESGGIY